MTADSPAAKGKVFTALAVSVDGYITGRGPGPAPGVTHLRYRIEGKHA
jgi:hypothetical protein